MKKILLICFFAVFVSNLFAQSSSYVILGKGDSGQYKCSGRMSVTYNYDFNTGNIIMDIQGIGRVEFMISGRTITDKNEYKYDVTNFGEQVVEPSGISHPACGYIYQQQCKHNCNIFFFSVPLKNKYVVFKTKVVRSSYPY